MTDNYIQLKNNNALRLEIRDIDGNSTGEYLEFDLLDTGLLLRYQELIERSDKSRKNLSNQIKLIRERQDITGKKFLSKNDEDMLLALEDYYKEQEGIYDLFLGEGGTKKLLQGRKLNFNTLEEINDIISEQIAPKIKINMEGIKDKIKQKYGLDKAGKDE